jgi:hypothetical protein
VANNVQQDNDNKSDNAVKEEQEGQAKLALERPLLQLDQSDGQYTLLIYATYTNNSNRPNGYVLYKDGHNYPCILSKRLSIHWHPAPLSDTILYKASPCIHKPYPRNIFYCQPHKLGLTSNLQVKILAFRRLKMRWLMLLLYFIASHINLV